MEVLLQCVERFQRRQFGQPGCFWLKNCEQTAGLFGQFPRSSFVVTSSMVNFYFNVR